MDHTEGQERLQIDLNCDMGEGFGAYAFGHDEELLPLITSANLACGFHAGDPSVMRLTVGKCLEAGVAVGAHPGLPDRQGFGRRVMAMKPEEIYDCMLYQIAALEGFVRAAGGRLQHVKPHGALYHMANSSRDAAEAVIRAVASLDEELYLYAQSGSLVLELAEQLGLRTVAEAFADRRYQADGTLMPRHLPGAAALTEAEAAEQALRVVQEGAVHAAGGQAIPVRAGTICIHGDSSTAVQTALAVRQALEANNVRVCRPSSDG
ncbi:LamB/YcsF family protein [Paenibacillus sambharensis]|uniref:5-oxoprolinase subunit A n=2 Tax=Paenibacillus sambharensis TaxID=1803190 RepID=A0A2W1L9M1_9BACL|nr:LamB/YcsF family protein [Paenibacillus sambharensis]